MRLSRAVLGLALVGALVRPAAAQTHYDFNVLYAGGNFAGATLAPGSDDPTGQNILPLDDFLWTIQATGNQFWHVFAGGSFFPLMAFGVQEGGERTGDFTLTLSRNGSSVFTTSEVGALNCFAHMGTNTIDLPTGMDFDNMSLAYTLTSELDDNQPGDQCGDPLHQDLTPKVPGDSKINGPLPIFGAPEFNQFSPGISFGGPVNATPEPGTLSLAAIGVAGIVGGLRRRKRNASR